MGSLSAVPGVARARWLGLILIAIAAMIWPAFGRTSESIASTASPEALVVAAEAEFRNGDVVGAMTLLRAPAKAGHVPAQVQLAYYLDYAEQNEEAFRWYMAAAEAEDPEAQHQIGRLYASGEGAPEDLDLARQWFERAACQGHAPSIRVLAIAYEEGTALTGISYEQAVAWLEQGIAIGDAWSLVRLSEAYRTGDLGLRVDRTKADALRAESERLESDNE